MSGCKIGKVRMKSGGAEIHLLPNEGRTHFHESIENAANSIEPDTHAFGFFVLSSSGEVTSGISYNLGFTPSQLKGSCEHMKDCLIDDIWGCDE